MAVMSDADASLKKLKGTAQHFIQRRPVVASSRGIVQHAFLAATLLTGQRADQREGLTDGLHRVLLRFAACA